MDFNYLLNQLVNGLSLGSVYALIAIGYSIVYGILRLINFAHGDILMVGVFAGFGVLAVLHAPFVLAILIAMAIAALFGVVLERVAYRPLRYATEEATMITSLAVSIFIENLGIMTVTAQPRSFKVPAILNVIHNWGSVSFSNMNLLIIAITVILLVVLVFFVTRTDLGIAMRACADNLNAARLMGININVVVSVTFAIGSALAAIAGLMLAGQYGRIDPLMGFIPGLKAFVAAVLGGIGSIGGAALGGFVLGMAEILLVGLLPPAFSPYRDAFVFIILILVLLVRPSGLLGTGERRRS
ncbi:MAG TPA: branched-chain amino acid ABC transporter permease [Syntrophomonas sp.]|nr:branched-chain amino acid ABC transporter permease [Syntrophomonas sp.]HPT69393.1 branched-chain amino acid ABC transporter permease [Syntrophomonas sp.]